VRVLLGHHSFIVRFGLNYQAARDYAEEPMAVERIAMNIDPEDLKRISAAVRAGLERLPREQRLANAEHFRGVAAAIPMGGINITDMGPLTYEDILKLARYGSD